MSLTLKRKIAPPSDDASRHTWPLHIECTAVTGDIPKKIFVYRRDLAENDTFSCVASVQQLRELPEDAPNADGPFFRKAVAQFECRNEQQQFDIWEDVVNQVRDLSTNWQLGTQLTEELTITIE